MEDRKKNADRFTGFAETYERARPSMPEYPVQVICRYLHKKPHMVVDLGCGTGLSTMVWDNFCERVVGVEPSEDMLAIADTKRSSKISFVHAYANNTGLESGCADAVVCSQSFHWMEPVSTIKEVNRLLTPDGLFATVDCDWPPVADWKAEKAYDDLYQKVRILEKTLPEVKDTFVRYSKEKHLQNIKDSGYFRYCRELLFVNTEPCTARRFTDIIISQGSLQTILKKRPELLLEDIEAFKTAVASIYGDATFEIGFCYRMRVGIK